jgi:hypothetical protein
LFAVPDKEGKQDKIIMFLYRDVLKKSISIAWNHKNLWFFGIFASLLGGVGQYTMSLSRSPEDWSASLFTAAAIFWGQNGNGNVFSNLVKFFQVDPVSATVFSVFLLIVVILSLFVLWLAVVSQIGLFHNAASIIKNNSKKETMPIRNGLEKGVKDFWPVFGLNVIGSAMTCFFAALVGLPLVFLTTAADSRVFLSYILLFLVFIPLALAVSFFVKYAIGYVVIKNRKFVDAFVDACKLFGKYWLISLEIALILFIIDFLFVFVLGIALLALAIPFVFAMRVVSLALFLFIGWGNFFFFAMIGGLFLTMIVVVLSAAMITTFKTTVWTDVFINLVDKKGGTAKLERLAAGLKK